VRDRKGRPPKPPVPEKTTVMQCTLFAHSRSPFTLTNEEAYLHMKTTPRTDTHVKSYALLGTGLERMVSFKF